jgi:hypothetical protein
VCPCSFQQVYGAHGIRIKIIKRDFRRQVVRGLGGSMHNDFGYQFTYEGEHTLSIPDVQFMMPKLFEFGL